MSREYRFPPYANHSSAGQGLQNWQDAEHCTQTLPNTAATGPESVDSGSRVSLEHMADSSERDLFQVHWPPTQDAVVLPSEASVQYHEQDSMKSHDCENRRGKLKLPELRDIPGMICDTETHSRCAMKLVSAHRQL